MPKLNKPVKTVAAIVALGLASLFCVSAEANGMDRNKLVDITRTALQNDELMRRVTYYAYQHDGKIGEAVKGDYTVLPEKIIPWSMSDKKAIAVVKVLTTRGERSKMYTFALVFSPDGVEPVLMYPGTSNADPELFSDVFGPAKGRALGALKANEANLKDTKVLGEIKASGWKEEWLWVTEKGESYTMQIIFRSSPSGGTDWEIIGKS